ncbi:hypothetical protein Tco_0906190 [Tanacetum coccineum]
MNNTMELIEKINKSRFNECTNLLKSLNKVSETLKDDSTLKAPCRPWKKPTPLHLATSPVSLRKNSNFPEFMTQLNAFQTSINSLSSYLRDFNLQSIQTRITNLENTQVIMQSDITSIKTDTSAMKEMMTEMFNAFKGFSSSTPSGSTSILTVTSLEATATVGERRILKDKSLFGKNLPFTLRGSHNKWPLRKKNMSPSYITPKDNKGKDIARDTDDSPCKLVKATREVCLDPNALLLINYEINRVMYQLTNEEIQAYLEKQEQMEKVAKEARLIELSKPALIKVDAEYKVLQREHLEKLKKKRSDQYVWTTQNRLKPDRITNIFIHPNTRPVIIIVYKNNDPRNFDVHKNFKFGNFGISEWDELSDIILKKENKVVSKLMESLSKKYERLKEIPVEHGIKPSFPLPKQDPSLSSSRKRKQIELEPEVRIASLECDRSLPEGV